MILVALAVLGWTTALALYGRVRRRELLVARACHELRGPLTAARLGLHLAAHGGGPGPLVAIEQELGQATRMLDDLAAAPAGRQAADRAELVEVGGLVAEGVEARTALARRHGATLRLTPPAAPAWVWGDRTRLAQACGNLLANAVEHGGGDVSVAVRTRDDRVLVDVEDGGPGLGAALEVLSRRARRERGPRGHGLAVAAGVAARHGGRLAGAPSPRGARLVLDLPAADPAEQAADGRA